MNCKAVIRTVLWLWLLLRPTDHITSDIHFPFSLFCFFFVLFCMQVRHTAIRCIQKNVRNYTQIREWEWWKLYTKVKPILNVHRTEEELKEREVRVVLLHTDLVCCSFLADTFCGKISKKKKNLFYSLYEWLCEWHFSECFSEWFKRKMLSFFFLLFGICPQRGHCVAIVAQPVRLWLNIFLGRIFLPIAILINLARLLSVPGDTTGRQYRVFVFFPQL